MRTYGPPLGFSQLRQRYVTPTLVNRDMRRIPLGDFWERVYNSRKRWILLTIGYMWMFVRSSGCHVKTTRQAWRPQCRQIESTWVPDVIGEAGMYVADPDIAHVLMKPCSGEDKV